MRHASARMTLDTLDRLDLPIEQIGRSLPLKLFTADPDTAMSCALLRYDAGFIPPRCRQPHTRTSTTGSALPSRGSSHADRYSYSPLDNTGRCGFTGFCI